jgi:hypothetical protein
MMRENIIEISKDKFDDFFREIYPKHHNIESQNVSEIHRLSAFEKNYVNQIFELNYGFNYAGLSIDKSNYHLLLVDKKLFSVARIKYGI